MAFFSPKTESRSDSVSKSPITEAHDQIRTEFLRLVDIAGSPEFKLYVELTDESRSASERAIAQSTRETVGTLWPVVNEALQRLNSMKEAAAYFASRSRRKWEVLECEHRNALGKTDILLEFALPSYALHRLTSGKVTGTDSAGRYYTSINTLASSMPLLLARIERNLKALQEGEIETDSLVQKDREEADWDEKYTLYCGRPGGLKIYI
ncbi:MAG: hypothetical protein JST16_15830 [Bdellovibrionales bacterium]|nr:hypothetical protein [Bdellovibrionales bacterium]